MLRMRNNDIFLTRGDTAYFSLAITHPDFNKTEYLLRPGDSVLMTVGYHPKAAGEDYIFQKTFSGTTIKIMPEDTEELDFGEYCYDIQLRYANGDINTIIPLHKFVIEPEVT